MSVQYRDMISVTHRSDVTAQQNEPTIPVKLSNTTKSYINSTINNYINGNFNNYITNYFDFMKNFCYVNKNILFKIKDK